MSYVSHVSELRYDEEPDYSSLRSILKSGLAELGLPKTKKLTFKPAESQVRFQLGL